MSTPEQLLIIQENDTAADHLRYRREHLVERGILIDLVAAHSRVIQQQAETSERRAELVRHQRRIEDEIAGVETKKVDTEKTLYSGAVSAPRELQSLQEEIEALNRRQDMLEDELLHVLTDLEPQDEILAKLADEVVTIKADTESAQAKLDREESQIDNELAGVVAKREESAASVSPEQLAEYEMKRQQLDGVAVSRVVGTSCGGCHLRLSAVQLDQIRKLPHSELAVCEECGRLLVH